MKKNRHDSLYFSWSVSILLCILLAVFALGFTSCRKSSHKPAETSPAVSETPSNGDNSSQESASPSSAAPTSPTGSSEVRLGETDDMGQEYVDKFIFLGDSTTYGLGYYEIVPKNQIWTPKNGTLTLSLWSTATIVYPEDNSEIPIKEAVEKAKPEYMLITLGVNGVSFMDEEYFIKEYTKLVQTIQEASPNTKIILNSIYPIGKNYPASNGITNEKIDKANTWVERIASSTGVKYLDSESVLKGSDGALVESYHNGDSMHLNADSFKLVINYLRTHGYK
ncbi:MAG: hypothetical protein GX488_02855 [Clostridiales bacterium]|nr:hypothetical protein [Clostridiales bacterium]